MAAAAWVERVTIQEIPYRGEFEGLIHREMLDRLDELMGIDDYFDEVPLYSRIDHFQFLRNLPVVEQNRALIRAATWHLETILEHAQHYYADREFDYCCMVSVQDWEDFEDGGLITPGFWFANPSRGVFDYLEMNPPQSKYANFVAECLDHDPAYQLNENYSSFSEIGVERVYIQRADLPAPKPGVRPAQKP